MSYFVYYEGINIVNCFEDYDDFGEGVYDRYDGEDYDDHKGDMNVFVICEVKDSKVKLIGKGLDFRIVHDHVKLLKAYGNCLLNYKVDVKLDSKEIFDSDNCFIDQDISACSSFELVKYSDKFIDKELFLKGCKLFKDYLLKNDV